MQTRTEKTRKRKKGAHGSEAPLGQRAAARLRKGACGTWPRVLEELRREVRTRAGGRRRTSAKAYGLTAPWRTSLSETLRRPSPANMELTPTTHLAAVRARGFRPTSQSRVRASQGKNTVATARSGQGRNLAPPRGMPGPTTLSPKKARKFRGPGKVGSKRPLHQATFRTLGRKTTMLGQLYGQRRQSPRRTRKGPNMVVCRPHDQRLKQAPEAHLKDQVAVCVGRPRLTGSGRWSGQ